MFGNQSLEFYGLKTAPIVRAEPTDLPQIKIDEHRMDFVFYLADDTLLHLEFQTTFSLKDLERFKLYDAFLYEEKKKPVNTAVIYGAGINETVTTLDHGSLKYLTYAVYMGNYDGDKIYRELLEKVTQTGSLNNIDRLNLIFLPLMNNSVEKSQRAIESIEIAQKVSNPDEQLFLIGCLVGISDKFIDKVYVQKMMEVLKMTQVLQALYKEFKEEGISEGMIKGISEGMIKGISEGMIKGKAEGKIELLCKFLKTKFGLKAFELQKKIRELNDMELIDEITEKLFNAESLEHVGSIIQEAFEIQNKIKSDRDLKD